jgi:UDP-N-acetyl-alpha-D-muramoyl-L-alanyl-L-glutamate epimerase
LGEFFYKNSIDFRGLVAFPFIQKHVEPTSSHVRKDRSLVLLGSGKDSITTSELLKKAKKTFSLFSLSPRPIHRETAQLIQASLYEVKRTIDPKLFELNKVAGMYNGHIPITAITSLTAILMAHLNDFRYVILSNEESANYGNVEYHGSMINHQWSKSLEFETLFREYLRNYVTSDIVYFSLLRGFTEFHIVKLFVTHPRYFNVFTSCNENFGVLKDRPTTLWCGNCPKCAFVFLMLAAYLPKKQLISIFQKNLFADAKLLPTYKELLALEGIKPFECVGTPEESLAAFEEVLKKGEYATDFVIQSIAPSVENMLKEKNVSTESVFVFSNNHNIPEEFVDLVSNI